MYFLYQLYIDPKVGLDCIKYAPPKKKSNLGTNCKNPQKIKRKNINLIL